MKCVCVYACKYNLRKGDLSVLSWAREQRICLGCSGKSGSSVV